MSEAGAAVFLSYASQDADAARKICDALRAAGIEVWFDQSELRGGDVWDQKIRRQIKECSLFVPVISANTQARHEGYFRLEWRLADQRTHLMGKSRAFIVPVCIDATRDSEADAPDSFVAVQWTRLPGGETPPAFGERIKQLVAGSDAAASRGAQARIAPGLPGPAVSAASRPRAWRGIVLGASALVVAVVLATVFWRPTKPAAASPSGGVAEIADLRAKLRPDEWTRADFDAFAPKIDRLIQAHPEEGDAWALRGIANSLLVIRNFDTGTKPLEIGKEATDRALRLAPNSPLAELSLGLHLVAMISRGGDVRACRTHIDRGLAGLPVEPLTRYAALGSYWLGYQMEGTEKTALAWLAADSKASFPAWILAQYHTARRHPEDAVKWAEVASADPDITGVRSFVTMFEARYYLQADLAAARATLDRIPPAQWGVHRVLASRVLLAMAEGHPDHALQELARVPDSMLLDRVYHGPKAMLAALAHEAAGRKDAAQAQFAESERVLHEELARDPENQELRALLALNLACLARADEARRELAAVEPIVNGQEPSVYSGQVIALLAQAHGVLGEIDAMATELRRLFTEPSPLPFTPASLRLDPRFGRYVSHPTVQALLQEFGSLDPTGAKSPAVDEKSVAVLAFSDLSEKHDSEYFSDGISEELLNVLAKVPGLKVTARTSAFFFKGKNLPIPEIAKQLGVAYVVEGSVQRAGDSVRITAQLIKAADGFHVWSDHFDRELKNIFALQDEIAGTIAKNLSLKLGAGPASSSVVKPEAFELYVQARQAWNIRTLAGFARAEELLNRCLQIEPGFARAHAALADVWSIRGQDTGEVGFFGRRNSPLQQRVVAEIRRALELDPVSAEAHAAFGSALWLGWEFAASERELRHAIELNPNYASAHQWLGRVLLAQGRVDEALAELATAAGRDPLSSRIADNRGLALACAGRFKEALAANEQALDVQPGAFQATWQKARILQQLGRRREAEAIVRSIPQDQWPDRFTRVQALASAGLRQEAAAYLPEVNAQSYDVAMLFGLLGRTEEALAALNPDSVQSNLVDQWLFDPVFNSLRGDSRFAQFIAALGLTEAHARAQAWRAAHPGETSVPKS